VRSSSINRERSPTLSSASAASWEWVSIMWRSHTTS
jgi:hypothetical protein